jgi:hypothetical protein
MPSVPAVPARRRQNASAVSTAETFCATATMIYWFNDTPSAFASRSASRLSEAGSFKGYVPDILAYRSRMVIRTYHEFLSSTSDSQARDRQHPCNGQDRAACSARAFCYAQRSMRRETGRMPPIRRFGRSGFSAQTPIRREAASRPIIAVALATHIGPA